MIKKIAKNLQPALGLTVGAIGANYVGRFVPVQNEKLKAAAPVLLGLFLLASGKGKGIIKDVAAGMIAGGGANLAKSFGLGAIPDPIMELDEIDINGDFDSIPNPINGDELPESELA